MFSDFSGFNFVLIVGGTLTWLVFVLTMAKLAKFYFQFTVFRRDMDTNLTGMGTNLKAMQTFLSELIIEQRRANKLTLELIDAIKKTEMDISYEEPISSGQSEVATKQQPGVQRFVFEDSPPGSPPRLQPVPDKK